MLGSSCTQVAGVHARRLGQRVAVGALVCAMAASGASAETIGGALSKAYLNNPDINQQRAAVRAADEGMPAAKAGYLPQINATASGGPANVTSTEPRQGSFSQRQMPSSYGATITENIWNGNQTENSVSQAESKVLAARESLRYTEQQVLLQALTDYMDVLRDTAILDLNKNNVDVLKEQLRQTKDRFNVGEVTRTDVAQAEASLAGAQAQHLTAQSTLQASMARYRQAIGDDPKSLAPVSPISKPLPRTVLEAVAISQVEHPAVSAAARRRRRGAQHQDQRRQAVSDHQRPGRDRSRVTTSRDFAGARLSTASLMGQINIPIFDGGATTPASARPRSN